MQKYRPYKKSLDYSYSLGISPTIELLEARPASLERVLLAPNVAHSTGVQRIQNLCTQLGLACEEDAKTIQRLSPTKNCYALGIFKKYNTELNAHKPHIVLAEPGDAGNLGTILRAMRGFGYSDLAIIKPSVEIFDPKVIRASMGSVFSQRFSYFDSIGEYCQQFARPLFLFMLEGDHSLRDTEFGTTYSLMFGNEGSGLPSSLKKLGATIKIEQTDAVDSLNLAVATSVAMYHAFTTKTR